MRIERKKEHKKVVKYMRLFNKSLANDSYLGLNRFRTDIYSEKWFRFEDGGGWLSYIFKISDKLTGNTAYFITDNYSYRYELAIHANDFLIRCSSGREGHHPPLHYVAYDVHNIIPYNMDNNKTIVCEDGIVNTYSWIRTIKLERN